MVSLEPVLFMDKSVEILHQEAIALLQELIAVPSYSKEEWETASIISRFLAKRGLTSTRVGNNVFVSNLHFNASKPTLLLNSHHDTVKQCITLAWFVASSFSAVSIQL